MQLDKAQSLLCVALAGVICHLLFKRFEFVRPSIHALLFLVVPVILSPTLLPHFSTTTSGVAVTLVVYTGSLLTSIVGYRLGPCHPLAKHPGPAIGKVSKLWLLYIGFSGKQHLYLRKLHERYGDVVRIGPNELSIRDSSAISPLLGTKGLPKGPSWDGRVPEASTKPLIAIRDLKEHQRRRRTWNRGFNTAALRDYESLVQRRVSQLMGALSNTAGKQIDIAQQLSFLAYNVMMDMAFGGGSEMLSKGDNDGLWHMIESAQPTALAMSHAPWIGQYYLLFPFFGKQLKRLRAFARDRGMQRRAQGSHVRDLFYHLSDDGGVEVTPPSMAEVVSDAALAILAGSDTTATVLSSVFFYLIDHPHTMKQLQTEVDDFCSLGENIYLPKSYKDMPYLNAVINETLRLSPPLPSPSQRTSIQTGKIIGSCYLPVGNSAQIPIYALQRDPRYFSNPDVFLPERWTTPDVVPVHDVSAFMSFSFGPSGCVGKGLAMLELRTTICSMVRRFEIRFAQERPLWEENLLDFFLTRKGRLEVVLTKRT